MNWINKLFGIEICDHIYAHWIRDTYRNKNEMTRQCVKSKCRHIERETYDKDRDNKFEPVHGLVVKIRGENLSILGLEEYPK